MFRNRGEAGHLLARRFKGRELRDPLVVAIPRGGVVTGAVLRASWTPSWTSSSPGSSAAPGQPELAIGAIAEDGQIYLNPSAKELLDLDDEYVARERAHQLEEIARRKALFRAMRSQAPMEGRSVIITDDGVATGATMIAALQVARARNPFELIVAVPVASPDQLDDIRDRCDELICLLAPPNFWAIGQFYEDFSQVEDSQALELLRAAAPAEHKM